MRSFKSDFFIILLVLFIYLFIYLLSIFILVAGGQQLSVYSFFFFLKT